MEVVNEVLPSPARAMEFFGGDEDGPFVMVNLLKFKPFAEYPDGSDPHLSGREAYARMARMISSAAACRSGGKAAFASSRSCAVA